MLTLHIHFTPDYPPLFARQFSLLVAGSVGGRLVSCVRGLGVIETPQAERYWTITPMTLEGIAGVARVEVVARA